MKTALAGLMLLLTIETFAEETLRSCMNGLEERFSIRFIYDASLGVDRAYEGQRLPQNDLCGALAALFAGTDIDWTLHGSYVVLKRGGKQLTDRTPIPDAASGEAEMEGEEIREAWIVARRDARVPAAAMSALDIPQVMMRHSPVLFGETDVLKTLQLMPGVQSGAQGFSGIHVRGGGPDENLILLDGVPLYNVNHLFGLFSVFTPESVDGVTLCKGAFPARYGGRISSVIDFRTGEGDMKEFRGTVSGGLLAEKLHLEGPLVKDRTSFSVSARGIHTVFLDRIFAWTKVPSDYYFYDVNGRLTHRFSGRDKASLTFYHGKDHVRSTSRWKVTSQDAYSESSRIFRWVWGSTVLSGGWNHSFGNGLFSDISLSCNAYRMNLTQHRSLMRESGSGPEEDRRTDRLRSGIRDLGARADFDCTAAPAQRIRFGAAYLYHTFRPDSGPGKDVTGHEAALYAEDDIAIGAHLSVHPGIRISLFSTQGRTRTEPEPRFAARYAFSGAFAVKASYSRMEQYVHLLTAGNCSLPTDLWVPITQDIKPLTSDQYAVGAYYTDRRGWEISIEGYWKEMWNVLEYRDSRLFYLTAENWEDNAAAGQGRSFGAELLVQKTAGKTTGWAGYTLSRTDRIFPDGSINRGRRFPCTYDRRHKINVFLNHRFSERTDLSAAWTFASGAWITCPVRSTVILGPQGTAESQMYFGDRNNHRLPPVHRLDVGVNFRKPLRRGERILSIGLFNVYCRWNLELYDLDYNGGPYGLDTAEDPDRPDRAVCLKNYILTAPVPSFSYTYKF